MRVVTARYMLGLASWRIKQILAFKFRIALNTHAGMKAFDVPTCRCCKFHISCSSSVLDSQTLRTIWHMNSGLHEPCDRLHQNTKQCVWYSRFPVSTVVWDTSLWWCMHMRHNFTTHPRVLTRACKDLACTSPCIFTSNLYDIAQHYSNQVNPNVSSSYCSTTASTPHHIPRW